MMDAPPSLLAGMPPPMTAQERAQRSVFVGNIPYEATEEQLKEIFSQAGPVVSFRLVYDRETGKPKGYGFCEYQDIETAQSAMRNLNNYDFNGRPLRVGVAAGEQNRDEIKSLQQATGNAPVESLYGDSVEPSKAPEAISKAVASLPPEQMFELMKQMKLCIQNNPNEARNMLLQNPQLAYALLQAQIVMKIVDPQVAMAMLHRQSDQIPPVQPGEEEPPSRVAQQEQPLPGLGGPVPSSQGMMGGPPSTMGGPTMGGPTHMRDSMAMGGHGGVPMGNQVPMGANHAGMNMGRPPVSSMGGGPPFSSAGGGPPSLLSLNTQATPPGRPMGAGEYLHRPQGNMGGPSPQGPGMRGPPMGSQQQPPLGGPGPRMMNQGDLGQLRGPPQRAAVQPPISTAPAPKGIGDMGGMRGNTQIPGLGGMAAPEMRGQPQPRPSLDPRAQDPRGPPSRPQGGGAPGGGVTQADQEKAALIMQVLQLSDQQIAMLPPDQRQSIMILKEQISRGQGP